jgi:predicted dehydrogenase
VEGEGTIAASGSWDAARAEVTFDDGFTAVFDVSRQAAARQRSMRVVYPSGEVEIDFLTRAFRNTTPYPLNAGFADTPAAQDTLAASIEAFLLAVRGETPVPLVGAADGTKALDLALAVEQALGG